MAVALAIVAASFAACSKGYREIVIIDEKGLNYHAVMEGGAVPLDHKVFAPGRIVAFRQPWPLELGGKMVSGLPGHIYRVTANQALEHVGEFDANLSDSDLTQKYAQ